MTLISDIRHSGLAKLQETYKFVFMGIVLAMLGAWAMLPYAAEISGWTYWGIVIVEFIVLFIFMFTKNMISYFVFTTLTGVTLVPIISGLMGAGAGGVIVQALLATSVITGGLTYYAGSTTKDYLGMGTVLMWSLLALIVVSIANIFIGSSILGMGISVIAAGLFSLFIIHDTQQVLYTDIEPLDAAMGMYLNILNLFTSLLHILSSTSGDD
jgi:modulator of FtsH protease